MDWALAMLLTMLLLVGDDMTRAERIPNEAANVDRRSMEWWKRGLVLVLCSTPPLRLGIPTTCTAFEFGENADVEYGVNVNVNDNSSSTSMDDMMR
mmetsp:Transcript_2513/g.3728  ORF Transcript_2513/g.3728 Transcript_2513/m.3728 type:complete len:96 (+) Transcript_2513:666-953(+)